MMRVAPASF